MTRVIIFFLYTKGDKIKYRAFLGIYDPIIDLSHDDVGVPALAVEHGDKAVQYLDLKYCYQLT